MNIYVEDVCCYTPIQTLFFFGLVRHGNNTLGSIAIPSWSPGKDFVTDNSQDLVSHTL